MLPPWDFQATGIHNNYGHNHKETAIHSVKICKLPFPYFLAPVQHLGKIYPICFTLGTLWYQCIKFAKRQHWLSICYKISSGSAVGTVLVTRPTCRGSGFGPGRRNEQRRSPRQYVYCHQPYPERIEKRWISYTADIYCCFVFNDHRNCQIPTRQTQSVK